MAGGSKATGLSLAFMVVVVIGMVVNVQLTMVAGGPEMECFDRCFDACTKQLTVAAECNRRCSICQSDPTKF
ncbi:unnamed protein product [Victoria cruziana]